MLFRSPVKPTQTLVKTKESILSNDPKPIKPNPTTLNPITEPPVNATFKALSKLVLAALVVRLFALVATFIPIKPANPDAMAPETNGNPGSGAGSGGAGADGNPGSYQTPNPGNAGAAGNANPGGAGGSGGIAGASNLASLITGGTSYPVVVPSGGYITITYETQ